MLRLAWLLLLVAPQDADIETLLKQLSDDSIEVREKAAAALAAAGESAEARLKKELESAPAELRTRLEGVLATIDRNKRLRSVLPPLKPVTIDAKDRNLKEVLEELKLQTGMAMNIANVPEATVTLAVKDAAPLEALDAICRAANLGMTVSREPGRVAFKTGPTEPSIRFRLNDYVDVPRCFVRHYSVTPVNLAVNRWTDFKDGQASAELQLSLAWTPETRPDACRIDIASVTDDRGRNLFDASAAAAETQAFSSPHRGQGMQTVRLACPEADVRRLGSVRGRAHLRYVLEEKAVVFEKPADARGQKRERDGVTVELVEYASTLNGLQVGLAVSGLKSGPTSPGAGLTGHHLAGAFRLNLEDGTTASLTLTTKFTRPASSTFTLAFSKVTSAVAALEIVLDTVYFVDTFDFELKDVPLPK